MKGKKTIIYFTAIVSGITILTSCSSSNNESKNEFLEGINASELVSSTTTIDTNSLIKWNSIRKDSSRVKAIFERSGNKFSFQKDSLSSNIHAYIGYLSSQKQLSFTLVTAKDDLIPINLKCLTQKTIKGQKKYLPKFNTINENNLDSIKWSTAKKRINNWYTDSIRNKWITDRFQGSDSVAIFQAFVIKAVDFEYGVEHDCYLSLKETPINNTVSYTADLVIVNSETGKIVSLTQNQLDSKNIEDLTRPVPPFGSNKAEFSTLRNYY